MRNHRRATIDKSMAFNSLLPVDRWNVVIPDAVILDAIRNRFERSGLTINITGDTYRSVKARNLPQRKRSRKTLK
jgi:hypothetical protein